MSTLHLLLIFVVRHKALTEPVLFFSCHFKSQVLLLRDPSLPTQRWLTRCSSPVLQLFFQPSTSQFLILCVSLLEVLQWSLLWPRMSVNLSSVCVIVSYACKCLACLHIPQVHPSGWVCQLKFCWNLYPPSTVNINAGSIFSPSHRHSLKAWFPAPRSLSLVLYLRLSHLSFLLVSLCMSNCFHR